MHNGNSIDPYQLASQKPVDMDLHCLQEGILTAAGQIFQNNMIKDLS